MIVANFTKTARQDFNGALDWYQARSEVALTGFLDDVKRAIETIKKYPDRFAKVDSQHRGCKLRDYPYVIIYREYEENQVIVAIAHTSRKPGYWKATGENQP